MLEPSPLETRLRQIFAEAATARVDYVGMLSDVQRESVWQRLRAMHCEVKWISGDELDLHAADHWQPVISRRSNGEYLFLDREGAQTLMYRASS